MIPKIVILFAALVVASAKRSYEGYKVYEVQQNTPREADLLYQLARSNPSLDFWHLSRQLGDDARVLVSPSEQRLFTSTLKRYGFVYSELIRNVESTLNHYTARAPYRAIYREDSILTTYLRHDEINEYLDDLARKYSSKVSVEEVGKSHEGRPLKTITINGGTNSSVIFLDAGIHAREWIAPATALYVINQLVEHSEEHESVLADFTWVILPVANPDGYEHSHEADRFWRKTRKPAGNCKGTDGNRNFDFHWGEVGASASPCADTYRGETAFSEPETRVIRDSLNQLKGSCKFYLTLHSYGNYLLYPWGWTNKLPPTWQDIDEVAQAGASAIKQATGTRYTVGSSTNVLYAAAGGSDDWAYAVAEVPISITMELPGGGSGGFNPPPSSIAKSVKESWVGIKAMASKVAEKYKINY